MMLLLFPADDVVVAVTVNVMIVNVNVPSMC